MLTTVDLFIYSGASSFDSPPGSHADLQGSANICAFPASEEIMPMTTCRLHSAFLAPPHFAVLGYLHFDQSKVCRCRGHFQFQALPQRPCLWRVSSFDTCLLLACTPNGETQVDPETRDILSTVMQVPYPVEHDAFNVLHCFESLHLWTTVISLAWEHMA